MIQVPFRSCSYSAQTDQMLTPSSEASSSFEAYVVQQVFPTPPLQVLHLNFSSNNALPHPQMCRKLDLNSYSRFSATDSGCQNQTLDGTKFNFQLWPSKTLRMYSQLYANCPRWSFHSRHLE